MPCSLCELQLELFYNGGFWYCSALLYSHCMSHDPGDGFLPVANIACHFLWAMQQTVLMPETVFIVSRRKAGTVILSNFIEKEKLVVLSPEILWHNFAAQVYFPNWSFFSFLRYRSMTSCLSRPILTLISYLCIHLTLFYYSVMLPLTSLARW